MYDGDTPSLGEVVIAGANAAQSKRWTAIPGAIKSYDATRQCADIDPLVRVRLADGSIEDLPVLVCVPVQFPSGGGYSITWPLGAGDPVMVHVCSRSISQWLAGGSATADPESPRQQSLTDAVAVPGLRPFSDPLAAPSASGVDLHIGKDDGSVSIRITSAGAVEITAPVKIGAGAHQIPGADLLLAQLQAIATTLGSLTGSASFGTPYVPPVGAAALAVSGLTSD